jgi:hypothetical protein
METTDNTNNVEVICMLDDYKSRYCQPQRSEGSTLRPYKRSLAAKSAPQYGLNVQDDIDQLKIRVDWCYSWLNGLRISLIASA